MAAAAAVELFGIGAAAAGQPVDEEQIERREDRGEEAGGDAGDAHVRGGHAVAQRGEKAVKHREDPPL